MNNSCAPRVMWLLNHTTLRDFEIEQLKAAGVKQIFLPKSFPYDEGNLSATVSFDLDDDLDLNEAELALLNAQDWYGEPSAEAWAIANRSFDIVFVGFFIDQIRAATRYFHGAIVLRAFGLGGVETYSKLIGSLGGVSLETSIRKCGARFWFGIGYEHLAQNESPLLADRAVYLPVGLSPKNEADVWVGGTSTIMFVCPRIGSSPYFHSIYRKFIADFKGFDYVIGGAQPIAVDDPKVLGFVSAEEHRKNMRQCRLMFYHSQEPNHIHYHPFEAIHAGMPLLFMAGGMLDRMGGKGLPGRCVSIFEARQKAKKIMRSDRVFIESLQLSQKVLLKFVNAENCQVPWRTGFEEIFAGLTHWRAEQALRPHSSLISKRRIAVIVPVGYRGGSLRGALLIAQALHLGSHHFGEPAEVVFLHLDDTAAYSDADFEDLPSGVSRRAFRWKILSASEARRAMRYAGFSSWEPLASNYMVPDDGIHQLQDCDLWLVVSDRLSLSVLPLKPMILMVFDYLQRYEKILPNGADLPYLAAAHAAEQVWVTTEFTRRDAMQYAGLPPRKVHKVPMLVPAFTKHRQERIVGPHRSDYFVWPTNAAPHKNHAMAAEALRIYFEEFDGLLTCRVTGVDSLNLISSKLPHLKEMAEIFSRSRLLNRRVKWEGEMADDRYRRLVGNARFLWHAGRVDNGTFCVVEAACLGVPALSSDYPAMREMDAEFSLGLAWMDARSPKAMAESLKMMEIEAEARRLQLPTRQQLGEKNVEILAPLYWQEARKCL